MNKRQRKKFNKKIIALENFTNTCDLAAERLRNLGLAFGRVSSSINKLK